MPVTGRRPWALAAAAVCCLALASLLLPYSPVYDPWAWLTWGRELVHGDLDTSGGPSFKPLPVAVCALLTPLGDAAPDAWLAVARTGWIAAPLLGGVLVFVLARGPRAAAIAGALLAAASIAFTADTFTPSVRQFAGGLSEPLLVALVLGAVLAELHERRAPALYLLFAAALIRVECWPFALGYGIYAVSRDPRLRGRALLLAALVPAAWFLPDLLSTGDAATGAQIARGSGGSPVADAAEVLGRAASAPLAAAWAGVALLAWGRRRRSPSERRPETVLLGCAGAWTLIVVVMAGAGYAGLPRFLAPATAVISVLGGVGVARALAATAPHARVLRAAAGAALLVAAVGLGLRLGDVPGDLREAVDYEDSVQAAFALSDRVGRSELFACRNRLTVSDLLIEPALAWRLDARLSDIGSRPVPRRGTAIVAAGSSGGGAPLAQAGPWVAVRLPC